MPELTRRRDPDAPECWHLYYGDVHVGTIVIRTGNTMHLVDRNEQISQRRYLSFPALFGFEPSQC